MARKKPTQDMDEEQASVWRYLFWTLLVGLWVLLTVALVSYNSGDWPNPFFAPHNDPPANLIGHVGAWVAYRLYAMLGPGVWILVAGILALLTALARRKPISQPVLRGIGLVLMAIGASALIGLTFASASDTPIGKGGLIAHYINTELLSRFNLLGTLIILLMSFWVGAIMAADQVLAITGRWLLAGANLARGKMRVPRPTLVGLFPRPGLARVGSGEVAEVSAPLARSPLKRGSQGPEDEEQKVGGIDPDAGGLGATQSFNPESRQKPDASTVVAEAEDETDEGEAAADDAPGAYVAARKQFTSDELRDKIRKLTINYAAPTKALTPPPREVDLSGYRFPDISLLEEPESSFTEEMERIVRDQAVALEAALQQYRIEGEVVGIDSGPVITLFEVRLAPGTKVSQINSVSSDLARALKAHNIRVVPNMAGKDTVGIEVPNLKKEKVRLKELMTANSDIANRMKLPMWLGKDASGNALIADLSSMPHMLIAGTTGSGKSVCMNSIIRSFLFPQRPDELKLVLVDPKMVEMSMFKDIPHLMCPVVTEMGKATAILEWATTKMDERYELLAEAGVRDVATYNDLTWEELKERFQPANEGDEARIPKKLPFLVFVIDELADLMMTNKEVEGFIVRLAQKSRAVGMHLILATQRPQANVVTGLIKSNMPCRISFKVASGMDSRIVLDQKGAELLLGQGDMLYLSPRTSKLMRAQGTLVDDGEIRRTVKFLKNVAGPSFEPQLVQIKSAGMSEEDDLGERDPLFDDAVRVVLESKRGSVSLLQRRLTIGYGRASRLIEQMAGAGILGDYKGSQARKVTGTLEEYEAIKAEAEAAAGEATGEQQELFDADEEAEEETEAAFGEADDGDDDESDDEDESSR